MNNKKQIVKDYDSYDNPYIASEIEKELEKGYEVIFVSSQPYYVYWHGTGKQEQFTVTTVLFEKTQTRRIIDTSKTRPGVIKLPYIK